MKIGKTLILLIICSLFLTLLSTVTAIDESKTLRDPADDVIYSDPNTGEEIETGEKPNIDIRILNYTRTGKRVTFTLTVNENGIIENRGNLSDFFNPESLTLNLVMYTITLTTSEDTYTIIYTNNVCNLSTYEIARNITDFTVDGNILELSFDLTSEEETYESILAMTIDYLVTMSDYEVYLDETNDIPLQVEIYEESYEGEVGEEIAFDAGAIGGASPYTWSWDFGDGTTSSEQYPEHAYSEAKTYTVTVTATDRDDQSATASVPVTVTGSSSNGNGTPPNDIFSNRITLFIIVIAIIIIIGVIVLVYILRR